MEQKNATSTLLMISLDERDPRPLYRQLYDAIRHAILTGELTTGARLPATRELAQGLGISRSTVMNAFEQLLHEGYIYGRIGSGTYVASTLPDDLLQTDQPKSASPCTPEGQGSLSRRGQQLATAYVAPQAQTNWDQITIQPFRYGIPDFHLFPFTLWGKLINRHLRRPPIHLLGYTDPAGYKPLREQIAHYLRTAQGVHCETEQVLIVSGSQQAIYLTAHLLLDPGDTVWIEEPCYLGTRGALQGAGVRLAPIPVDEEGMNVSLGIERSPQARLAYVTPSHQFPLGTTLSLTRRLALLQWAQQTGAWIIEDDYDSEFRYTGRPLSSLQGLDAAGRVIYVGTMSKVLFPGLRLGYIVVPPHLVDSFTTARALIDRHPPLLEQLVLTDFIEQEHFARHIRRMRQVYAERQHCLLEASKRELAGLLTLQYAETGMHLVGKLEGGLQAQQAMQAAARHGVLTQNMASYFLTPTDLQALLIGYTAFNEQEILDGVRQLARALTSLTKRG